MYGEVHMMVGIAFQKAGPIEWAIPASIMSHIALDDLNVGAESIYHALGTGWRKALTIAARALLISGLTWWLWDHPAYLVCGLISWLCFDIEWVIGFFLGRHGLGWHERMFPAWFRSRWGLLINIVIMVVLFGLTVGGGS